MNNFPPTTKTTLSEWEQINSQFNKREWEKKHTNQSPQKQTQCPKTGKPSERRKKNNQEPGTTTLTKLSVGVE